MITKTTLSPHTHTRVHGIHINFDVFINFGIISSTDKSVEFAHFFLCVNFENNNFDLHAFSMYL